MSRLARSAAAVAAVLTCVAGVAGCGSSSPAAPATTGGSAALRGSITVFAAASLTGSFTTLAHQFEAAHPGTTVKLDFGASSTLAQQIIAGAPADVFASAATVNMQQVVAAGDAADPTSFAANTAEIAVAPRSASQVTSLRDLAAAGVTVATCQPQVPCGALAQQVFAKAGLTVKPVTEGLDVKSTLAYVTDGQVDAAVVYVTDVRAAGSAVVGVRIPSAQNASTEYPIATVRGSTNLPVARAFTAAVESAAGSAVLAKAGFSSP